MNDCPHYDYGKSADTSLGAYCTKKKTCVEAEDCETCERARIHKATSSWPQWKKEAYNESYAVSAHAQRL